jgi:single-stranded-DNA-specific exonuclease
LGNKMGLTTNKKKFQVVYCIDENEWNGATSLQLRLKDME